MDVNASPLRVRGAIAVAGAASLLAQVVLVREILASSRGNELVVGLVLGAWLALTALATAIGSRWAGSLGAALRRLAAVLVLAPLLFSFSLWLVHFSGTGPLGDDPSLLVLLAVSLAALVPACALGGLAFAWAATAHGSTGGALHLYVAETAGAAVAGALFHFVLAEHLAAAWILALAGASCAVAGAVLLPSRWRGMLAAGTTLLAVAWSPTVARALTTARFPGARVLAVQPSRYGLLTVVARGEQRVFFHDGVLLFTTEDELAAEETVHLPMLLHPRPRRVLLIGGGLGGGLAKVLEHGPETVDYAEMDPAVLALARVYADRSTRAALADPRVHAAATDARAVLREAKGRYDVILLTLPVAENALLARLSTRELVEEARRALAPGGIFAVVTPGSGAYLAPAARHRHASLLASLRAVFPVVGVAPDQQTIIWASGTAVDARADLLADRLRERGVRPLQIGRAWLFDRLLPLHAQGYLRSLAGTTAVENRDFRPHVYLLGVIEHLERASPRLGRAALSLAASAWARWLLAGGVLAAAALGLLVRRGRGAPGFAAAAAGAGGMALEMVLLLAFQSLAGHLYHALGGLLAGFMVGMAGGALWARRWLGARHGLAWALVASAAIAALVPAILAVARMLPAAVGPLVLAAIVLTGLVTGAVYPLAVKAAKSEHAAARIYAWDLLGAAGAALVVSLLAIPLLGLFPVAALSAALCAAAALSNRQAA